MKEPKQIAYFYDTLLADEETELDLDGTVDVPVKRGVARTEMPAYPGATISVATGVVMGNEIRWK